MTPASPRTSSTLGGIARRRGLTDTAVAFHRQALAIDRRLYGDGHLVVAEVLNDLGVALDELGDLPAADSAAAAALAIKRRWLDPDHPSVITSLHNLGLVREDQGDYQESERLKREVVERFRRLYPDGHPDLAVALKMLGSRLGTGGGTRRPSRSSSRRAPCSRPCWGRRIRRCFSP